MALPFTTISPCPEEYQMIDDKCVPIHNHHARIVYETTTQPLENLVQEPQLVTELNATPKFGSCPEGTKHDEYGLCKKVKYSTTTEPDVELTTELNVESTTELNVESTTEFDVQPTTEFDVQSTTEFNDQFTTELNIESTTEFGFQPTTEFDIESTTEYYDQSTTEEDQSVGGVDVVKGCPKGTEPDEQGACQAIESSSTIKTIIDPKVLLNENGSCPNGYGMSNGRCLFIGSKSDDQSYQKDSAGNNNLNVEYVPTLSDNSCPEGTIYSAYGLCQKRLTSSNLKTNSKSTDSCPSGYQSVNGKCLALAQYTTSTSKNAIGL